MAISTSLPVRRTGRAPNGAKVPKAAPIYSVRATNEEVHPTHKVLIARYCGTIRTTMATSISKITLTYDASASGVIAYMSDIQSVGDYYSEGDRAPMRWLATERVRTAFALRDDLVGVGPELGLLLEGRHPVTGEVIRRWGPNGSLVAAHDVTISPAPKSVSILWGLGDRELQRDIEGMVWQAASQAILALTDEALVRERYGPGSADIRNVVSPDIVGVDVLHTVARLSNEAEVPDPQLHVHTLLIGALDAAGQLRALDSLAIHRAKAFVDAFASSHLAAAMQARGFQISRETDDRGRVRWEVVGVPDSLVEAMSSRHKDVEQLAKEYEDATGREAAGKGWDRYMAARRRSKRKHQPGTLRATWEATAAEHGFGWEEMAALVTAAHRRRQTWTRAETDSKAAEQFRREFLAEVCREHALVPQRQALKTAMQVAIGLLDPPVVAGVLSDMYRDGDLLVTEDSERGLVTTPHVLETERRAINAAMQLLKAEPEAPVDSAELERILRRSEEEGRPFDSRQAEAIRLATSGRRLVSITGPAGTGKGVASAAIVEAFRAQGRRTIALAVAGRTAQQAQADSGADTAFTLDGLIARLEHVHGPFHLAKGDVLIVDEAGVIDHDRYADLLTVASLNGATVVQIGDSKQLSPVEAGGLWTVTHALAEEKGAATELATVRRARDPREAEAWTAVRDGRVLDALGWWKEQDRLQLYDDRAAMHAGMVANWWTDGEGQGVMLVDTSNVERDAINRLAQRCRQEAGQLGDVALGMARGREIRAGDHVLFNAIHQHEPRRVENGTLATVVDVDQDAGTASLILDEPDGERAVVVDQEAPLELAYCRHVAKGQGMTAEGIAHLGVGEHTNANGLYVMVSRGRDGAQIHAVTEDVANIAMPTLPAPSDEQREQLAALGLEEIPTSWSTVDAALELDDREGRPLGSSALERLEQTAIGEEIAHRIVVNALRARQEHEEAPITQDQVAPQLTAALEDPVPLAGEREPVEHEGASFLADLNAAIERRQAELVTVRQIAKAGERDATKHAIADRPVAAGEFPAEQVAMRRDRWGERDTTDHLQHGRARLEDLATAAERKRRMDRHAAEERASERLQEVREAAKERPIEQRPEPRPERVPDPLPAARPMESVARAHLAGNVERAEGYYRALGQVRYSHELEAEAARAWLADREAAVIVRDAEQAEAVRSAIAEQEPDASPRLLIAQEAYAARAAKREEPDAQVLPVDRAYVIASDRFDRRHLTHALSATPEAHWITGAPSPADERQIALEARTVQAAMDARRAAEATRGRARSKERVRHVIDHQVEREATRTRTNSREVA